MLDFLRAVGQYPSKNDIASKEREIRRTINNEITASIQHLWYTDMGLKWNRTAIKERSVKHNYTYSSQVVKTHTHTGKNDSVFLSINRCCGKGRLCTFRTYTMCNDDSYASQQSVDTINIKWADYVYALILTQSNISATHIPATVWSLQNTSIGIIKPNTSSSSNHYYCKFKLLGTLGIA